MGRAGGPSESCSPSRGHPPPHTHNTHTTHCLPACLPALPAPAAGTWFLGRDGWCDGQNVRPWVTDVTAQLLPPPALNNATYVGQFQGATPDPTAPAVIIMQSFVSLYGTPGSVPPPQQ